MGPSNEDETTTTRINARLNLWDNRNELEAMLSKYSLSLNHGDFRYREIPPIRETESTKPAQREIDDLLSKELLKLSMQDRNAITEEIHGVQTIAPRETPIMIHSALRELTVHVEQMPRDKKAAFLRAQELYPDSYINTEDFRLRFLRCDLFDTKKAAIRFVEFLDLVSDLFGDYVLRRPIQITDFTWEEMQVMRHGNLQLLPYRDRSGRRIFAVVGGLAMNIPLSTKVKILIYLLLSASEDVESQRMGITSIVLPGVKFSAEQESSKITMDRIVFMKRFYSVLPIRTSAIHFCLPPSPYINIFRTVFFLTMPKFRSRMKFHTGERVEVQYMLKGYGIPVELIPLTDTGNIKTIYLKQWIKLRKTLDAMYEDGNPSNVSIIECPRSNDVLFRPGTSVSCHPGNVRFRCLLENTTSPDHAPFKLTQAQMAEQLIQEVESKGGKFLKWDKRGYWIEIADRMHVHTKVALSIRDFKYKSKMQQSNRQNNESYTYLFCQEGSKRKREQEMMKNPRGQVKIKVYP